MSSDPKEARKSVPADIAGLADSAEPADKTEPASTADTDPQYIRLRLSHVYLALIPVAALVGFGAGYLVRGQDVAQDTATAPIPASAPAVEDPSVRASRLEVDPEGDPFIGPVDAPVTIVEFSDFNCPHCQNWHQNVSADLLDTYGDQIRFVYKDFPIVGGGRAGFLAAQAAHCAEEQDAYWEYHNAMFSGGYVLDSPGVDQAAVDLGLDLDSFKECMVEARYADEIRDDFNYGVSLGVSSTPTFFINGIPLVGAQPLLNFAEIIDGELGN